MQSFFNLEEEQDFQFKKHKIFDVCSGKKLTCE